MAPSEAMTELYVAPIVCLTDGCPRQGKLVNYVSGIAAEDLDYFYEGYDESCPEDYCPACGQLGIAYDPIDERTMARIHRNVNWRVPIK